VSTRKAIALALVALTLVALALRLRGIGHGLPMVVEQDCKIPYQVELLRRGDDQWKRDKEFRWYPLFVAYAAELWPEPRAANANASLEEHLAAAARPHLQVRWTVALLAVLLVPATFLLARRFVEPGWALAAAAFVAFSLLHQSFSQQSRPHAVSGTTFLAVVLAALALRDRAGWWRYGLALLALAVAVGTLQSGALCILPILIAHWLRRGSPRGGRRVLSASALIVAVACVLSAATLAFYPALVWGEALDTTRAHTQLDFDSRTWTLYVGGHEIFLREFAGRGTLTVLWSLWSYEPCCSLLASRLRSHGSPRELGAARSRPRRVANADSMRGSSPASSCRTHSSLCSTSAPTSVS
jgi:hypothetical protein